jgi:hypothetical protein
VAPSLDVCFDDGRDGTPLLVGRSMPRISLRPPPKGFNGRALAGRIDARRVSSAGVWACRCGRKPELSVRDVPGLAVARLSVMEAELMRSASRACSPTRGRVNARSWTAARASIHEAGQLRGPSTMRPAPPRSSALGDEELAER